MEVDHDICAGPDKVLVADRVQTKKACRQKDQIKRPSYFFFNQESIVSLGIWSQIKTTSVTTFNFFVGAPIICV